MPSVSDKQENLMAMVAHGGKPTKAKAPPVKVAKEYNAADTKMRAHALRNRKPKAVDVDGDGM